MVDRIVTNSSSLQTALGVAKSGDRILLAPGSYGSVSISKVAASVTITSQDTSHEAVLKSLSIDQSSGLTVSNLEVAHPSAPGGYAFTVNVTASHDVTLSHLNIHGSLDNNPSDDMMGVRIAGSQNVTLDSSEIQQFHNGLSLGGDTGVVLSNNNIHDIQSDGVDVVTNKNLKIDGNKFHDFHELKGDHSDAIQFFTAGQTAASAGVTISNNQIYQGSGTPFQGIFLTDQTGTLPYSGVVIDHNVVLGGNWNAVRVDNATDVTVTDNWLAPLDIINTANGNPMLAQLVINGVGKLVMGGNHASVYSYGTSSDVYLDGNSTDSAVSAANAATASSLWTKVSSQNTNLAAGSGGQLISGTSAADRLVGVGAGDTITGGAGADTLISGGANEHLVGGAGADHFAFTNAANSPVSSPDTIGAFSSGDGDKIDLSALDPVVGGVRQPFTIVKYFTHHPGQLVVSLDVDHAVVTGDINGDGVADFAINVNTPRLLGSGDFIL
jgi:Ca2+-binding RTX toxin-like protein